MPARMGKLLPSGDPLVNSQEEDPNSPRLRTADVLCFLVRMLRVIFGVGELNGGHKMQTTHGQNMQMAPRRFKSQRASEDKGCKAVIMGFDQ